VVHLDNEQEKVRQSYINYLQKTGTKACVIAKRVDIPASVLSQFKHGRKNLFPESLKQLEEYLKTANENTVNCTINVTNTYL
jgi:hypothetical protein